MELVRVTEAAAMAAGRWVGRGDKNGADEVAVNAMRVMISTVGMNGIVVIGEGEKDNAPMLYNGEQVGDGTGPECDVAVDPIDGTTLTAKGMNNAIAVLAVAPRGAMYDPSAVFYMKKLVTGPEAADVVDIRHPVAENIHAGRQGQGLQRRGRHRGAARPAAPRASWSTRSGGPAPASSSSSDGDVAGAIMAARPDTGVDLLLGIGGTPEGIIAACAMKCTGGVIQGQLWPQDDDERQKALDAGHDLDPDFVLGTDDLVTGDDAFFVATGITDGELMRGVRYRAGGCTHRLAGDAGAQRHHPLDHLRAPAGEATRFRRDRLRPLSRSPAARGARSAAATCSIVRAGRPPCPTWEAVTSTGVGDRVDAGAPVDDPVAPGVDRGERDLRRQRLPALLEALPRARARDAVLRHQPGQPGAAQPHQHVDAAGERRRGGRPARASGCPW